VFVTRPNELHWGRDAAMHPCTLYWLIVGSPTFGFAWSNMETDLASYLEERLQQLKSHHLRATPGLQGAFQSIFREHQAEPSGYRPSVLCRGDVRASLHRLLIDLVRIEDGGRRFDARPDNHELPPELTRAIETLRNCAHDPNVVHLVCKSVGTDYRKLNKYFMESLGTTLAQYWLRERVRLARQRLLETKRSVTEVATELGFSSSQHFATVFRKVTGLTPSEYRGRG